MWWFVCDLYFKTVVFRRFRKRSLKTAAKVLEFLSWTIVGTLLLAVLGLSSFNTIMAMQHLNGAMLNVPTVLLFTWCHLDTRFSCSRLAVFIIVTVFLNKYEDDDDTQQCVKLQFSFLFCQFTCTVSMCSQYCTRLRKFQSWSLWDSY